MVNTKEIHQNYKLIFLLLHMIEVKLEQSRKASSPIEVTLSGMVIEVKPEQPSKAQLSIEVTPSGMVIEVKPVQPLKAPKPIEVAPSGMVIEVKPEHTLYLQLIVYQFVLIKTVEKW